MTAAQLTMQNNERGIILLSKYELKVKSPDDKIPYASYFQLEFSIYLQKKRTMLKYLIQHEEDTPTILTKSICTHTSDIKLNHSMLVHFGYW